MADRLLPKARLYGLRNRILEGGKLIPFTLRDVVERREVVAHVVFEVVGQAVIISVESGDVAHMAHVLIKLDGQRKRRQHRSLAILIGLSSPKIPASLIGLTLQPRL